MAYQVEGRLLEVCTCKTVCPCWVGEDPDGGACDGCVAWRIDSGTIDGIDVSGRTLAAAAHIPGNILKGGWRVALYIDDGASDEQQAAMLKVWSGKAGGPIADLAKLIGEIASVERVPIRFDVQQGNGSLQIGGGVEAHVESFVGATGRPTVLSDSVFSTIPGSPAYVGKASRFKMNLPQHGFRIELSGHNAIQGTFMFQG